MSVSIGLRLNQNYQYLSAQRQMNRLIIQFDDHLESILTKWQSHRICYRVTDMADFGTFQSNISAEIQQKLMLAIRQFLTFTAITQRLL